MDHAETPSRIDILRTLTLAEFAAGLQCARRKRDESAAVFDEYCEWYSLLEPYFCRDPGLTVDEALELYRADCVAQQRATRSTN